MKNWVVPIPKPVTLFPRWLCALSSSLLLYNGDKEHGSSPDLSKALPSPLSQFSSMMCTPHLLCSHSHPHSVPFSSCIMLLYAPSNSPTSLDWFWPYPSCTLGPLVCFQAVTLAKYTSSCCPLSLPLLLRLPLILCLDF